jgi:xylulokinase
MTTAPLSDPQARVYNHRGPDGTWLPGAASNCGGRVLRAWFGSADLADRDAQLAPLPTGLLVYPLIGIGERYPVRNPRAVAFVVGEHGGNEDAELYTACLEGIAFVERWGYDVIEDLGGSITGAIATTGGASHSEPWLRIRASVLGRAVEVPTEREPAFGAAILATVGLAHAGVCEAAAAMVAWANRADPERDLADRYAERYGLFREQCRRNGLG